MAKSLRSPAHAQLVRSLRAARKAAHLSQEDVARRLGRPQSYVAKVETGERRLDVVEFILLAREMALDPVQIIRDLASLIDIEGQ